MGDQLGRKRRSKINDEEGEPVRMIRMIRVIRILVQEDDCKVRLH